MSHYRRTFRSPSRRPPLFLIALTILLPLGGCTTFFGKTEEPGYAARIVYLSPGTSREERGAAYLVGPGLATADAKSKATRIPGIGGKKAPAVQGISISSDGTIVGAVTEEGLELVGVPSGKNLFALPFQAPPRFSDFFSGPVFSGDARRIGFAIPGLIGPGGAEALHVLIHRLALDGTTGGTPIPLPPSGNLSSVISLSSDGNRGVVWATPPVSEEIPALYLLDFETNKIQPLSKELVPLSPALMTPDGKNVIVSALNVGGRALLDDARPQLYRIGARDGGARKMTRITQPAALRPLGIGKDGSVLFSVSPATQPKETQIRLISPQRGATSLVAEKSRLIRRLSPGQSLLSASVSPDRTLLAYVVCDPASSEDATTVKCTAKERGLLDSVERVLARFSQPADKIGFLSPPMIGWVSLKPAPKSTTTTPTLGPPRLDH